MRLTRFLAAAGAAGLIAFAATAQDAEPSDEAAVPPQQGRGLADLEATVNQLLEEEGEPLSSEPQTPSEAEPSAPAPEEEAPAASSDPEPETRTPDAEEPAETGADPAQADPDTPPAETPPAAPSSAGPAERPAPPLTRAEIAQVERSAERGRLLIAIARAGILATQDMLTRVSDPEGAGIAGWIAEPEGNAMAVTFYSADEDGPRAVYRTSVLGGRVVAREVHLGGDRPALGPVQARMARARAATEALDHQPCNGQPFNVLVVPPESPDAAIDVYQVTPPASRGSFPLGGHFRSTIGADNEVVETRPFTNSCVEVEAAPAAAGAPSRPIGVTHLLDPIPTEIHLFLAQLVGRPLLVATGEPQRVWLVTNERIAEIRD